MDEYNNYQNGYNQNPPPPRRPKKRMNARWLWIIPVIILAAILVMDSFYTLKEDQYAVLTTFGKPTTVSASGLQPKIPLIQKVHKVSKSIQSFPLGYRVGSNESIEEESLMITYDYNFVNVDFYVEYRITDPIKYLYNSSDPVGILKMLCQSYIRDTIGLYNVDSVITTGKSEIQSEIKQKVTARLETEDLGLQVTNITIQDAEPPTAEVQQAFTAVETAKQAADTAVRQRGHPRGGGRRRRDRQAGRSLSGEQDQRSHRSGRALHGAVQRVSEISAHHQAAPVLRGYGGHPARHEALYRGRRDRCADLAAARIVCHRQYGR